LRLVPDDFTIPAGLEHERFRLRMLSIDDVVKDFDAICDRVDRDPFTNVDWGDRTLQPE
jgi:hypothetical protein